MPSNIFTLKRWLGLIPSTRGGSRSGSAKTEGGIFWASSPMYTSDPRLSMTFAAFFFKFGYQNLDYRLQWSKIYLIYFGSSNNFMLNKYSGVKWSQIVFYNDQCHQIFFFFNISIQTDEGLTAIHNAEKFLCHLLFKTKTLFSHFLCWHLKITKELNLSGRSVFTVVYHISYTKRPPSCSGGGCCWGKWR